MTLPARVWIANRLLDLGLESLARAMLPPR